MRALFFARAVELCDVAHVCGVAQCVLFARRAHDRHGMAQCERIHAR